MDDLADTFEVMDLFARVGNQSAHRLGGIHGAAAAKADEGIALSGLPACQCRTGHLIGRVGLYAVIDQGGEALIPQRPEQTVQQAERDQGPLGHDQRTTGGLVAHQLHQIVDSATAGQAELG